MGGEATTFFGALVSDIPIVIPSGFSPDLGVMYILLSIMMLNILIVHTKSAATKIVLNYFNFL